MVNERKSGSTERYNRTFPTRLRELMEERGIKKKTLADAISRNRSAVGSYCDGTAAPGIDVLSEIANFLNVSPNYLLGFSDVKTLDSNMDAMSRYTSLSGDSLENLHAIQHDKAAQAMFEQAGDTVGTRWNAVDLVLSAPDWKVFDDVSKVGAALQELKRVIQITPEDSADEDELMDHCSKAGDAEEALDFALYRAKDDFGKLIIRQLGADAILEKSAEYRRVCKEKASFKEGE